MPVTLGQGDHKYRVIENWAKVPDGYEFKDVGAIALLDVPDNETLHQLMNEWAEIIPATFEVYPVIDPGPAKAYLKKHK